MASKEGMTEMEVPPALARAVGQDPKLPEITSPEAADRSQKTFDFRIGLKRLKDAADEIRRGVDRVRDFEEALLSPEQASILTATLSVLGSQSETAEKVGKALDRIIEKVRASLPEPAASPNVIASKEEWHIHKSFQYPDPMDVSGGRRLTYGPGEPIPPNLTEEDAQTLWAQDYIRKFNRAQGISEIHPRTVNLSRAACVKLLGEGLYYLDSYIRRNHVSIDSLVLLQKTAIEEHADPSIRAKIGEIISERVGA